MSIRRVIVQVPVADVKGPARKKIGSDKENRGLDNDATRVNTDNRAVPSSKVHYWLSTALQ